MRITIGNENSPTLSKAILYFTPCTANQLTGFYTKATLALNGLSFTLQTHLFHELVYINKKGAKKMGGGHGKIEDGGVNHNTG